MKLPLVSVCVPTYNGGKNVLETLRSILDQTYSNFEVIVCDDASCDDTLAHVRSIADPRLRIFERDHRVGAEANWNYSVKLARGKYVKVLPQDDVIYPECLLEQVSYLESEAGQNCSFCFSARDVYLSKWLPRFQRGLSRGCLTGVVPSEWLLTYTINSGRNPIGEPGAILFRRVHFDQVGGFDGSLGYVIDLDYWIRLLAKGDAYYVDEPLCMFRVSTASWSARIGTQQHAQYMRFVSKLREQGVVTLSGYGVRRVACLSVAHTGIRSALYFLLRLLRRFIV